MRSVEEVEVTIASRVPRFSNTLTWGVRLLRRAQVNRAVAYGILSYGWRFLSGPVSIVLIGTHFSRELQGYYYTFSSLLALQLFVELGMGTVITQFASHEWSRLGLDEHGRIVGEEAALSRLVSLGRLAFRWYLVAGAIFVCGAGVGGYIFFSHSVTPGINWVIPWFALCLLTGITLWLVSVWSLLEGCNQVSRVYAFKMIQAVVGTLAAWAAILVGAGLWTGVASTAVGIACALVYLAWRYRRFFDPFWSSPADARLSWRAEMWPMQWRLAVGYVFGYFSTWIFVPMLFRYHGPIVAGQFGMSWGVISSVSGIAAIWSAPRAPQYGMLIAKKEYEELDRFLFRVTAVATSVLVSSGVAVCLLVYVLTAIGHPFASRLMPPLPTGVLAFGVVMANLCTPFSVYLRAHKREPFMGLTVVMGVLTVVLTSVLARRFGAMGAAATYAGVASLVGFPAGMVIWYRCRARWHADIIERPA
jgi:O-antigen/teichoic acid export membrane protein